MGIGKEDTALGQAVNMRRLGLGMSSQATDPVIQVIDGNH
jgi:hypothetical protein